jgi:hypothetical protein
VILRAAETWLRDCEEHLRQSNPGFLCGLLDCFAGARNDVEATAETYPRHCEARLRRGNPAFGVKRTVKGSENRSLWPLLPFPPPHSAALAAWLAANIRVGAGKPQDVPSVILTSLSQGSRMVPATMSCMKV